MRFIVIVAAMLAHAIAEARTPTGGGFFSRNQNKESVHWTLADWMTQTQNFRAMDYWLAMNRSINNFEFNLEGGQQNYDITVGTSKKSQRIDKVGASVYWSIFGLEYQREDSSEDFIRESGQFNLRLFGTSSQSTNLILYYGLRKWTFASPVNEVKNQYAGAKLNLYIFSFFGLEGQYRRDFRSSAKNGIDYEGDRVEYGAFVDVSIVRIYGQGFKETTTLSPPSGSATKADREGLEAGVKLYF